MTRYAGKTAMLRNMIVATTAAIIFPLPTFAAEFTFPPGSSVTGRSVTQLSTEWWQWAMSIPQETSPLRDSTGANCGTAQQGAVWFLAGALGHQKSEEPVLFPPTSPCFFR